VQAPYASGYPCEGGLKEGLIGVGLDFAAVEAVPLGPAKVMHFSRKTIGLAADVGPRRPFAGHGNARTAFYRVIDTGHSQDPSPISAGPDGTLPHARGVALPRPGRAEAS